MSQPRPRHESQPKHRVIRKLTALGQQRLSAKVYQNCVPCSTYDRCQHMKPQEKQSKVREEIEAELVKFQSKIEARFKKSELRDYVFARA
jgi:hypothetical protein